jgi:hypothetical protein
MLNVEDRGVVRHVSIILVVRLSSNSEGRVFLRGMEEKRPGHVKEATGDGEVKLG